MKMMAAAAAAGCAAGAMRLVPAEKPRVGGASDEGLDEALLFLQKQEPRSRQGLSTHAPMAAEALCALGLGEKALSWVRDDRAPLLSLPVAGRPVDPRNWRAALGPDTKAASWEAANARWADWTALFTRELGESSRWQDVLDRWVGRLAPGMSGAATHGVIRTAHAARALGRRDTAARRGELGRALAYWASSYEELPSGKGRPARFDSFADALAEVPLYWETFGRRPDGRMIVDTLRQVRTLERFAEVRDLVAAPADLHAGLSALTATFTRVYLRHGTEHDTIAFVHGVTGPVSLRRIAPHVSEATARAALPYAWQAAAAIFSAYARTRDLRRAEESRLAPGELAARAAGNGDPHAIKFTEVMLAEHALNQDPVYLAAAEDVVARL